MAGFEPAISRFRAERSGQTLLHPDIIAHFTGPVKLILDPGAPGALPDAGSLGADHENCTHTNWLEASRAAVEH